MAACMARIARAVSGRRAVADGGGWALIVPSFCLGDARGGVNRTVEVGLAERSMCARGNGDGMEIVTPAPLVRKG
ncbi:hypothetical protein GCM10009763_21280 [Dermacoccus profundi]|uniref:Uncharacterized protein n=3 Tax=Dermacoccus TaxID=57495 RepID=A0ABN2AXY5_9MICO